MRRDAELSECGLFRWKLSRTWDGSLPVLLFIMLNPSTADAMIDDSTIKKCIGFAIRGGYGGIVVVNLFAYRTAKPAILKRDGWQQGNGNALIVRAEALRASRVCVAWGANARRRPEAAEIIKLLNDAHVPLFALRVLSDGVPEHPLMLPYSCKLSPFNDIAKGYVS